MLFVDRLVRLELILVENFIDAKTESSTNQATSISCRINTKNNLHVTVIRCVNSTNHFGKLHFHIRHHKRIDDKNFICWFWRVCECCDVHHRCCVSRPYWAEEEMTNHKADGSQSHLNATHTSHNRTHVTYYTRHFVCLLLICVPRSVVWSCRPPGTMKYSILLAWHIGNL